MIDLIKVSIFTIALNVIKILSGFISNKVIAIYTGPSGIAMIGQFCNFISIVSVVASGGINSGVTKYIAEYHGNDLKINKLIKVSFSITLFLTFITALIVLSFYKQLSLLLFGGYEYKNIFLLLPFFLIFISSNAFFLSLLNGFKDIKKYTLINVSSNISNLALIIFLSYYLKTLGVLLSLLLSNLIVFFVSIALVKKYSWFNFSNFTVKYDKATVLRLFKYSLMAITTAITLPLTQILIRDYITQHMSIEAAGYWQSIGNISGIYLMFITSSLSFYYLPKLSELKDAASIRREIFNGYKIILPIVGILLLLIFLFKTTIIKLIFTEKFLPMENLFPYYCLGDFFKIASWLISFLMIAKAMTGIYIIMEVIFSFSFVLLSIIFLNKFGLQGVTIAYCLNYLTYFISLVLLFRKLFFLHAPVKKEY